MGFLTDRKNDNVLNAVRNLMEALYDIVPSGKHDDIMLEAPSTKSWSRHGGVVARLSGGVEHFVDEVAFWRKDDKNLNIIIWWSEVGDYLKNNYPDLIDGLWAGDYPRFNVDTLPEKIDKILEALS